MASRSHPGFRAGVFDGIAAAVLFGSSTPLSKRLLPGTGPLWLAALLYLGAGLGLGGLHLVGRLRGHEGREAPLRRADLPWLAGVVGLGGIAGPVLMLVGLSRMSALSGSLLLNLEGPLTILLAVALFGEHLGRREAVAAALVRVAAALLGYRPGELGAELLAVASVAGACSCWALDNNFTQRLSLRDPVALVRIKGMAAGVVTLGAAVASGAPTPAVPTIAAALVLGVFTYGTSIVLHIRAVRTLGASRQAALFATAPFAGAAMSVPVLGEQPQAVDWVAAVLMLIGVLALLTEQHEHVHVHEAMEHEHVHVHEEHHRHEHAGMDLLVEPHSHPHRHEPLLHSHPHTPDVHHRHSH